MSLGGRLLTQELQRQCEVDNSGFLCKSGNLWFISAIMVFLFSLFFLPTSRIKYEKYIEEAKRSRKNPEYIKLMKDANIEIHDIESFEIHHKGQLKECLLVLGLTLLFVLFGFFG